MRKKESSPIFSRILLPIRVFLLATLALDSELFIFSSEDDDDEKQPTGQYDDDDSEEEVPRKKTKTKTKVS